MSDDVREIVLGLLRGYPRMQQQIAILRYQLNHMPAMSAEETIASMNFSHSDSDVHASNPGVSNKTQNIAINYQAAMDREESELRKGLRTELRELETQRDELINRIALLQKEQNLVLQLYYIKGRTWEETAAALKVSIRTAQRIRNTAVSELCRIYEAL